MYLCIGRWNISFVKIQKYAFADSLCHLLTITNRFGKLASWQTSFRKKLGCLTGLVTIISVLFKLTKTIQEKYVSANTGHCQKGAKNSVENNRVKHVFRQYKTGQPYLLV